MKNNIFSGVNVGDLEHLELISKYNQNYYLYQDHLIFGVSDDDNTTEWYLVSPQSRKDYIGVSYLSDEPEVIINEHNT